MRGGGGAVMIRRIFNRSETVLRTAEGQLAVWTAWLLIALLQLSIVSADAPLLRGFWIVALVVNLFLVVMCGYEVFRTDPETNP